MNEYLSTLGLCLRAGRLTAGIDAAADSVADGDVRLVVLAADAGDSTERRMRRAIGERKIPVIRVPASAEEIGAALGRLTCAVCCIREIGFAATVAQKAAQDDPTLAPIAQQVAEKNSRIASRRGKKKPGARKKGDNGSMRANAIHRKKRGGERA